MSTALQLSFNGKNVRILGTNESPLFVTADVCKCIGISNARDAFAALDEDEKGVANTDTLGGIQKVTVVNESGLYSLIFKSRKQEAKEFKKWVTSEVLPAIRKTGSFSIRPQPNLASVIALLESKNSANARELIEILSPSNEYGTISEKSGLPRTRYTPGYFTSRWATNGETLRLMAALENQMLIDEVMSHVEAQMGLSQ